MLQFLHDNNKGNHNDTNKLALAIPGFSPKTVELKVFSKCFFLRAIWTQDCVVKGFLCTLTLYNTIQTLTLSKTSPAFLLKLMWEKEKFLVK